MSKTVDTNIHLRIFIDTFRNLITSSAGILKAETDHNHLSSLSSDGTGVRIGREGAVSVGSTLNMDPASPAMVNNNKQSDYVIDVLLPTILMALLFVGNAVIVYLIFQYRKRKVPSRNEGEELTLQGPSDVPHV